LAFLKISASNLPTISFANSDDFQAGEKIIAVGNSLDTYQNRYASGILKDYNPTYNIDGKTVSSSEKLEGVFEADFNSEQNFVGGPILDYSGQVIGMTGSVVKNNAIDYFQIPSNKAEMVLQKTIKQNTGNNAQLGIYYVPITKSYALVNNLSKDKGALIFSPSGQQGLAVIASSPAAKAGLKINDIITAIDGREITLTNSLSDLFYNFKKGDTVNLTITRDGQEIKTNIQL
jgi:S1-C subfamily serine protease